jgi:hypothetical protein
MIQSRWKCQTIIVWENISFSLNRQSDFVRRVNSYRFYFLLLLFLFVCLFDFVLFCFAFFFWMYINICYIRNYKNRSLIFFNNQTNKQIKIATTKNKTYSCWLGVQNHFVCLMKRKCFPIQFWFSFVIIYFI